MTVQQALATLSCCVADVVDDGWMDDVDDGSGVLFVRRATRGLVRTGGVTWRRGVTTCRSRTTNAKRAEPRAVRGGLVSRAAGGERERCLTIRGY